MILTVHVPDSLVPYLEAAAVAAGQPDLATAVTAHLAELIRENAQRAIHEAAMAAVAGQVQQGLASVDEQNALIAVSADRGEEGNHP